jgi:hypothetical protein
MNLKEIGRLVGSLFGLGRSKPSDAQARIQSKPWSARGEWLLQRLLNACLTRLTLFL